MVIGVRRYRSPLYSGKFDLERTRNFLATLSITSEFHEDTNMLLDLRDTELTLNFEELSYVILQIVKFKSSFKNKIASVIPNNQERIKIAEYIKTTLQKKHNLKKVEYFTDYEKAIDWLSDITPLWDG